MNKSYIYWNRLKIQENQIIVDIKLSNEAGVTQLTIRDSSKKDWIFVEIV